MEERNYNVATEGTLTLTITLEEYRYLLKRDIEADTERSAKWAEERRHSETRNELNECKKRCFDLEEKLAYIQNMGKLMNSKEPEGGEQECSTVNGWE